MELPLDDSKYIKKIISIKNFFPVNQNERLKINQEIEDNWKKYSESISGYNFPILDYESCFFDNLYNKFLDISKEIFGNFLISPKNKTTCWCYRSYGNTFDSIWHHHKNTSTINSVYYYQINSGDSISFLDEKNSEFKSDLSEGELLIFPNHLIHKPNPPVKDILNRYRYSINMEIITEENSVELFNRI